MNAVTFDTHAFVKRLTAAGMPEPQAEVLAEEQSRLIDTELSTKRDIKELETATRRDIKELETATRRDLREMEYRITATILKWMFGALAIQATMIIALIKLL